jgi:phosphate/sulfate permease
VIRVSWPGHPGLSKKKMFLRNKIQTVTSTRIGPRLISKNLAKANEKKNSFVKKEKKRKKKKRPREWSRLLLIGFRLFIPFMYGLN